MSKCKHKLTTMSRYIDIFKHDPFTSFGQALIYFVDSMGLNRMSLCEKIFENEQKARNFNTQISRWERTGANPSNHNLNLINNVLLEYYSVSINQNLESNWILESNRTLVDISIQPDEIEEFFSDFFEKTDKYKQTFLQTKRAKNLDSDDREMIYIGLKVKLLHLIEKLK